MVINIFKVTIRSLTIKSYDISIVGIYLLHSIFGDLSISLVVIR